MLGVHDKDVPHCTQIEEMKRLRYGESFGISQTRLIVYCPGREICRKIRLT